MRPSQQLLFFLAQTAILLLTSLPIQAQQQQKLAETVSVRLSDVFTVPGTEASIPFIYPRRDNLKLQKLNSKFPFQTIYYPFYV